MPDPGVGGAADGQFAVRPAAVGDARAMAELFAAVAQERDAIATEPPVDVEERTALFARTAARTVVAVADGRVVGIRPRSPCTASTASWRKGGASSSTGETAASCGTRS